MIETNTQTKLALAYALNNRLWKNFQHMFNPSLPFYTILINTIHTSTKAFSQSPTSMQSTNYHMMMPNILHVLLAHQLTF